MKNQKKILYSLLLLLAGQLSAMNWEPLDDSDRDSSFEEEEIVPKNFSSTPAPIVAGEKKNWEHLDEESSDTESGTDQHFTLISYSSSDEEEIDHETFSPTPPLIVAAKKNDPEGVKKLLENGIDINRLDDDGQTALHWAASRGHLEVAELILQQKPNLLSAATKNKFLPLHSAVIGGNVTIAQAIINAAKEAHSLMKMINAQDTLSQRTPLLWATRMAQCELTKKDMPQHTKETSQALVQLLLDNGADRKIADKTGFNGDYWLRTRGIPIPTLNPDPETNWREAPRLKPNGRDLSRLLSYKTAPKSAFHTYQRPAQTDEAPGVYVPPHLRKKQG